MRRCTLFLMGVLSFALLPAAFADECNPTDTNLLKPRLQASAPTRVRVLQRNSDRKIIFTTTIANVGDGPLILTGQTVQTPSGPVTQATQEVWKKDGTTCTHVAGYFEFHPSHNHWHFNDFASYQLRRDDPFTGPLAASSSKVSFCLIDITQLRGFNGPRQVFADCTSQQSTQGISVGFADVYDSFLPDQWIDLDLDPNNPVPAGAYFLVNIADPDNLILGTADDLPSRSGVVSVSVPPLVGNPAPPPPPPGPTPTPGRPPRPPRPPRPHSPHSVRSGQPHMPGH